MKMKTPILKWTGVWGVGTLLFHHHPVKDDGEEG